MKAVARELKTAYLGFLLLLIGLMLVAIVAVLTHLGSMTAVLWGVPRIWGEIGIHILWPTVYLIGRLATHGWEAPVD